MIKQYAVCLADRVKLIPGIYVQNPKVYFDVWKSLNKRFQQRMVSVVLHLLLTEIQITHLAFFPLGTGRKLNGRKTFRRRRGRLLNVNLSDVFSGFCSLCYKLTVSSNEILQWKRLPK